LQSARRNSDHCQPDDDSRVDDALII
jgi:hypothetical protein